MSPEDIITMNWLVRNIIGSIPTMDDLIDEAKPVVKLQGLVEKDVIITPQIAASINKQ